MLIIQKYGGTSLADGGKIQRAAGRIANLAMQGCQMVVVVSAQGDTTDEMIARAAQVNKRGSSREMDAYLSAGEQMSAGLMAMAIGALGCPAVSLTGAQAGIHTDGIHGNARIRTIDPGRIQRELAAGKVVVVAGFQGVSDDGDTTTLGRGGSDTTAVALAAYLKRTGARFSQMWMGYTTGIRENSPMRCASGGSPMKKCCGSLKTERRFCTTGVWNLPRIMGSRWRFCPPLPATPAPLLDRFLPAL